MVGFHFKGPAERSIKNSACLNPPWLRCIIINISISQSDPVIDTQEASLEFLLGRCVHREGGGGWASERESEREREREREHFEIRYKINEAFQSTLGVAKRYVGRQTKVGSSPLLLSFHLFPLNAALRPHKP